MPRRIRKIKRGRGFFDFLKSIGSYLFSKAPAIAGQIAGVGPVAGAFGRVAGGRRKRGGVRLRMF